MTQGSESVVDEDDCPYCGGSEEVRAFMADGTEDYIPCPHPCHSLAAAPSTSVREEVADLKQSVIAFCAPWAVTYARDLGLPDGHLHPEHYDILAKCGARMDDFTRAALVPSTDEGKRHG